MGSLVSLGETHERMKISDAGQKTINRRQIKVEFRTKSAKIGRGNSCGQNPLLLQKNAALLKRLRQKGLKEGGKKGSPREKKESKWKMRG